MLLAYLPRKVATARGMSTKLDFLLLSAVEETDKIVLLILHKKIPSLWSKWNRNYHPNSIEDVLSHTVTTENFKLSFNMAHYGASKSPEYCLESYLQKTSNDILAE